MPIFSKLFLKTHPILVRNSKSYQNILLSKKGISQLSTPIFCQNNAAQILNDQVKFSPIVSTITKTFATLHPDKHETHCKPQGVHEELSSDYSQFNFVEAPKETIVSVKTIRKYWELIPLLVALAVAGGGAVLFVLYSLLTKHDVMRTADQRHGKDKPWDHADPEKTGKLYVPYEGGRKIPELEALKKILKEK
ncbi:unnamed protein product [Gordionus sp. m RMFG-2023]|uniref:uncharacterized protein LOC135932038 n=1 Tax=Gordionus sp. m RMFG-2023 TaxID=3053472 RepID=UPI0030E17FE0